MKDFLDRAQRFLESRNINAYNIALYENGETRCRKLQKATGIELFHLDAMYWNKDGTHITRKELIEKQKLK